MFQKWTIACHGLADRDGLESVLRKKVHKRADFRRDVSVSPVNGVNGNLSDRPVVQNLRETALTTVIVCREGD